MSYCITSAHFVLMAVLLGCSLYCVHPSDRFLASSPLEKIQGQRVKKRGGFDLESLHIKSVVHKVKQTESKAFLQSMKETHRQLQLDGARQLGHVFTLGLRARDWCRG